MIDKLVTQELQSRASLKSSMTRPEKSIDVSFMRIMFSVHELQKTLKWVTSECGHSIHVDLEPRLLSSLPTMGQAID